MRRICALEFAAEARDTRWGKSALTWAVQSPLPGVLLEAFRGVVRQAFASWASVCGLAFAEAAPGSADILIATGPIDGPSGTLAWSELPPSRPVHQRYDTSERWSIDGSPERSEIELLAVACHEIGHALGLQHAPQGAPDLMAPFYSASIFTPRPGDIARIQALYGPPAAAPVPPPPPATPAEALVLRLFPDLRQCELPAGWTAR